MCTALGMEPERVAMMEWADITRLYRYWAEAPPTHELVSIVAQTRGWKKPLSGTPAERDARPQLELSAEEIRRGFELGSMAPIGGM